MWFVGLFLFGRPRLHVPQSDHPADPARRGLGHLPALEGLPRGGPEARAYYKVPARQRAWTLAVYLGLVALLVVGMDATYLDRDLDDV
jgi:hypothetical protein